MDSLYIFVFTKIASTGGFIVAVVILSAFLYYQRKRYEAFLFLTSSAILMAAVSVLKHLFAVPRPPNPIIEIDSYAFPSGHAAGAMFLALSIVYLTCRLPSRVHIATTLLVTSIVLLIGLSRVQLGLHTYMQVIAGFALGIFGATVFNILRTLHVKSGK